MLNQVASAKPAARHTWPTIGLWLAVIMLLSLALARLAVWLQSAYIAPIGIFPLAVGAVIAAVVTLVANSLGFRSRPIVIVGAVTAALIVAVAEHGLFYLDYRNQFLAKLQTDPKAQLAASLDEAAFRPATFSEFMSAEAPSKTLLWILDPLTMIAIAALSAYFIALPKSPASSL